MILSHDAPDGAIQGDLVDLLGSHDGAIKTIQISFLRNRNSFRRSKARPQHHSQPPRPPRASQSHGNPPSKGKKANVAPPQKCR